MKPYILRGHLHLYGEGEGIDLWWIEQVLVLAIAEIDIDD